MAALGTLASKMEIEIGVVKIPLLLVNIGGKVYAFKAGAALFELPGVGVAKLAVVEPPSLIAPVLMS